jgi:response regulator RpfG family c-di-GMP phosphodiesterase
MNNRVLLVDDEVNVLNGYRRTLRNKFSFDVAKSGMEALKIIKENKQYAVVISDMQMPVMNGIELLSKIKLHCPHTVRIMLTGNADQKTAIDAVNIGDIFRFINKPCKAEDLSRAIEAGIEQYNLIISEKVLLSKTLKRTINVLNEVLTVVNPDIFAQISYLKTHMLNLAKELKLKDSWSFEPMIQLSQLGYIMFQNSEFIPGCNLEEISPKERRLFEKHPQLAANLINKIPRMKNIANTILYQEKCFNGAGFPHDEIAGENIPFGARMLKVVLDYLRCKNNNMTTNQAITRMEQQSQYYDPTIFTSFKRVLEVDTHTSQKLVLLTELNDGMIIEEDIRTDTGLIVAVKGQDVTEPLRRIISHCVENGALKGEVIVIENE